MTTLSRRRCLTLLLAGGIGCLSFGTPKRGENNEMSTPIAKIIRSDSEWKKILTPEQYHILREEGTEPAFSSPLNQEYRQGTFLCAGCGLELFDSSSKYDSKTGWPSFFAAIAGHIATRIDHKLFFPRTEYHCLRCQGHQGHLFEDGPPPTRQRYCNNGLAITFRPANG